MARVTVEDCLKNVKNRFELVILASKRARQLMRGTSEPKVAWENDKPTVVALREIAMGYTEIADTHHIDASINPQFLAERPVEITETDVEMTEETPQAADSEEKTEESSDETDQTTSKPETSETGNSSESE